MTPQEPSPMTFLTTHDVDPQAFVYRILECHDMASMIFAAALKVAQT